MRCLYCGKELALLKRLTRGSEFCSEAHRTQYQEEFNDLALNRLLQSRSAGDAEAPPPERLVEEFEPVAETEPVAKVEPVTAAPRVEAKVSPKPQMSAAKRAPVIPAAKAKSAPKPQAKEAVVGMTGWIIVPPEFQQPGPAAIAGGEPPMFEGDADPVLPWQAVEVQQLAREYGLQWANPVSWTPPVDGANKPVRPVERNVEVRDFSRQASPPVLQQERSRQHSQKMAPSSAVGEAMDITNQPRQPAYPPVLWQAGPQATSASEPVLGELARLNFPTTGYGDAPSTVAQPAQSIPVTTPAPLPQPAAAAPPPVPVPAIVEEVAPSAPAAAAPAPPATQPLPLTLQSVSANPAKPAVVGNAASAATLPQTPPPTALPLRPAVVLGPAVPATQPAAPPQPKPAPAGQTPIAQPKPPASAPQLRQTVPPPQAPVIKPVAPTVTQQRPTGVPQKQQPVEAAKPQTNAPTNNVGSKGKRPEVRIIPTAPTQPTAPQQVAPPRAAAAPPAQPPGPKHVAQPAAKAPVPIAPEKTARPALAEAKPEAKPQPKPEVKSAQAKSEPKPEPKPEPKAELQPTKAEAKHVATRSTLISSDVSNTPTPITSGKSLNLGLPELHAVEEGGFWAKLPGGVKIAVAAVLVLAIFGFAFTTLNSSSATAKVTNTGPVYELGRPMNTNGWIENWTPNDNNRRVTLLRGSQNSVDYRMQFNAQIQSKAVGWMFRGLNPRNFYVGKIEKSKSGADFVRYAVIDGRNEGRVEKPLEIKGLHVGTIYQIKFEAIGSTFKVWVQGNLVDEWTDKRLGSGGLGLYSEKDEVGIIQGDVNAYELVVANAK